MDYKAIIYTSLILIFFILSYFVILKTRLEELFKQGSTIEIRIAQALISLIVAYGAASAIMALVNNFTV
jgi:uncharacterized membrane protein YwzB